MIDYTLFKEILFSFDLGLVNQVFVLGLIFITAIAITRQSTHIKEIMFPIAIGYSRIGLNINFVFIIALGLVWAITIMNTSAIGGMIKSIASASQPIKEKIIKWDESIKEEPMRLVEKTAYTKYNDPIFGSDKKISVTENLRMKELMKKFKNYKRENRK